MPLALNLLLTFFLQLFVKLKFPLSLRFLANPPIKLSKTIVRLFPMRISLDSPLIISDRFWKVSLIRM